MLWKPGIGLLMRLTNAHYKLSRSGLAMYLTCFAKVQNDRSSGTFHYSCRYALLLYSANGLNERLNRLHPLEVRTHLR